ncbi:MAG: methyltransferase [Candidatus Phytoplasma asteris]|uniref:SAM-dependent methyltransferase n=1 Tax=Onion yellows phytoplasma OY-W TaxID=428984 RepID=A6QKU3_ONYPH|nr:MAG: SAM-dependent methyltransferase [Periwinkle leaf yellowing phytoplasma]WEX19822.1 MAG: methyltransferase [Candidatus Phytoplasma asteris]BAF73579.1 SAM-dependent methyltransferase [Onion yellows phytoplasma OY-W]
MFDFNKEKNLQKLKKYAQENKIPIIQDQGLALLLDVISQNKITNILEIGTAIGYSALAMSSLSTKIDTLERDFINYNLAKNFLKETPYHINVIWSEALIYPTCNLKKYDLIFIDAAKAQYQKLFFKYAPLLKKQGIIVFDNLNLSCFKKAKTTKNNQGIFKKMHNFQTFLTNHPDFCTTFQDVGDGLIISYLKK